ncbi:MAG: hypothetical protein EU547_03350 [Promethearchaeota archaeon]|nr:MAG: hypothetical protein EU547_03350 [Candidatus Lokiarchaeota archaeon]
MKMTLLEVIIPKTYKNRFLMDLAEKGIAHIRAKESTKATKKLKLKFQHKDEIKSLKSNLRELFKELKISQLDFEKLDPSEENKREFKVKDLYELIHYNSDEINYYMNRINELERYITQANIELENVNNIKYTYKFMNQYNLNRTYLQKLEQFDIKSYITFSKNLSNLKELFQFDEFPNLYEYTTIPDDRIAFFVIYPQGKEEDLDDRINIIHGEEIPILKKYLNYDGINFERIDRELESIKKTLNKYEKELDRLRNENLLKFAAINEVINNLEEYNWAENQFSNYASDRLILEFFVPSESSDEIKNELKSEYQSNIKIKSTDIRKQEKRSEKEIPEKGQKSLTEQKKSKSGKNEEDIKSEKAEEDITKSTPTKFEHNRIIRPFEELTKMYGVPSYSEIDPTPFLFFTFPLLFGIMFGDIGHGLVLIIAGIIGGIGFKNKSESMKNLSWIIFWCGLGSILFGMLYGECFGGNTIFGIILEPISIWLPKIGWITVHQPLNNVMGLLWLVIFIGVLHLNLGMIIEFFNYIVKRKIYQAFAEPLMKILFLDFLVYMVLNWGIDVLRWLSPPYPILLPIIPGLLLIVLKPLGKLFGISYLKEESYGELLSEGSIETFETALSIPSNILSYLRLLALALAHISLMVAIQAIVGLLTSSDILTQIVIIFVLILGNALVIILEGILAFINALRLNFYEFFFKFYEGVGTEYDPFKLSTQYSKINFKPEEEKDVISEEIEKEIESEKTKAFINEARTYIERKYLK